MFQNLFGEALNYNIKENTRPKLDPYPHHSGEWTLAIGPIRTSHPLHKWTEYRVQIIGKKTYYYYMSMEPCKKLEFALVSADIYWFI